MVTIVAHGAPVNAPTTCAYHLEALDFRLGVERSVCCESSFDAGWWLSHEGYTWTGKSFYLPPQGERGKGLMIRILRDGRCGHSLSSDEQRREILPHFAAEHEMV